MNLRVRGHLNKFIRMSYVNDSDSPSISAADEQGWVDCALGTNPFGYPDTVKQMYHLFNIEDINKYPDFPYERLKRELVSYWRDVAELDTSNIRLGSGSMGVIEKINKIFIENNARVLGYCPQFTDFMVDVECAGGSYEYVLLDPQDNYRFDKDKLKSALNGEHRLVYIDNPNNPTGQVIPVADLEDIVESAGRMGICVIVDEAYGDFMERKNSAISLVSRHDNLVVVRSFSKGFGLAGIRVGYLVTGRTISGYYSKVDAPFSVNTFGQWAAIQALKDRGFIDRCTQKIQAVKKSIVSACRKLTVLETDLKIPIMTLKHPDPHFDLCGGFRENGILTESGGDFVGLGKNFVRLRVPCEPDRVIDAVLKIESQA
ncbi:MAG: Histidinol-phosphate aminotransferase [Firmicutes bacterium]|nr:Histidinol-phosphate aminotransferase [Bacillota bacterium]